MDYFPGDDNFVLWRIQHDMYQGPEGIGLLCAEAESRYSAAVRLLSVKTDLWEAIKQHDKQLYTQKRIDDRTKFRRLMNVVEVTRAPVRGRKRGEQTLFTKRFDHRVLQGAYYTIAAAFRFHNPELWLPLFSKDEAVKEINSWAWKSHWGAELERLVQNDKFVVAVLTSVAFQNEGRGCAAENELAELLRLEYEAMFDAIN